MGGAMSQTDTTHNPTIDQLQKLHRRRMAIFGLVILIAGIAIGAALTVILMPRPKPFPAGPDPTWFARMMSDRLERVLELTGEQKESIRLICRTAFEAIRKEQEDAKGPIDAAIKTMNEGISGVLTDEQNAKWQRDIEEFKKRFRDRWRGRRPGEGGPGSGRRRGSGDPNREYRGPGGRPGDPNRSWGGFRQGPGDPNHSRDSFRRGSGPFGPGDPNRPRGGFDREAMRDRYRRGDDSFDRRRRPDEANRPSAEESTAPETTRE